MSEIGIVEGFFGPTWPLEARLSFAPFFKKYGGSFYIYAPKRDAYLRKSWRDEWPEAYVKDLVLLRDAFQAHQLKFGVALSPFGLGSKICDLDWSLLKNKFKQLAELKINYLGLFFDDMPVNDELLDTQSRVVGLALEYFPKELIFCPSFYSFDPILDKIFGNRPVGYVEGLNSQIPAAVEICWTGPKVISEDISNEHLREVGELLGRKPFIWENLYANDGPRNCKFLKLKYFDGRDSSIHSMTSGIAFNLMNQPYLSQLVYLASVLVITKHYLPQEAFELSCNELCSKNLSEFIVKHRTLFLEKGLDQITDETKNDLVLELKSFNSPFALEMSDWLQGKYLVGPECLTD
jgi:hyaluronoglucosaminidase